MSRNRAKNERSTYRKRILAALTGADFILAGEPTRADENHFFSADLFYPNLFDAGPGLRPHIRVEMTLRPPALPPIPRPLASLIGMAQQKPPEVAAFLCVDPVETAADKLSALAWRVHARHQTWANTARRPRDHASRHGAMAWCEENDIRYVFGLSKNAVLDDLVYAKADEVRTRRATGKLDVVRDYTETRYAAKSWPHSRRVVARFEATPKGLDTRYVVTNITHCGPQWLYDSLYCARGQAENLIKRHKSQLASDRTSCRSPLANQMRLILHTAAYWLMRTLRDAIPQPQKLASGEFSTIRLRLLKVAVRIKETASRVRLAFASNCPDAALFRGLVSRLVLRPT